MTINLILIDELGTDTVAETITSAQQTAIGEHLENYIAFRLNELRSLYPEARGVYREDIKTPSELRCEEYEETLNYWLKWAEEHPEEIDDWDPEEWAEEQARSEMDRGWW
jgi:hypothetical protein